VVLVSVSKSSVLQSYSFGLTFLVSALQVNSHSDHALLKTYWLNQLKGTIAAFVSIY